MDETGAGLATRFGQWAKDPFTERMDIVQWFLFIGLVVIATAMWKSILGKIT